MADQPKSVDTGANQADVVAERATMDAAKAAKAAAQQPAPTAAPTQTAETPEETQQTAATQDDGQSAGDEGGQQPEATNPGKKNTPIGVQKKLDKLTREKYEAQAREQQALAELERMRREIQQPARPQQAQPADGRPTLESCNNDPEAYLEALAEWKASQVIERTVKQRQEQERQQKEVQQRTAHGEREKAFAEAHPDYYDAAYTAPINYSPAMLDYVTSSEKGPEVAYYLAQHLDEARAIEQLPEHRKGIALFKVEQALNHEAPSNESRPARTVTQAPQPPATIAPSGHTKRDIHDESLSTAERIAIWRKREKRA